VNRSGKPVAGGFRSAPDGPGRLFAGGRPAGWFGAFLLLVSMVPGAVAGMLVVQTNILGVTPVILGYNSGHFYPGSNTREWWRYTGVSGARVFVYPSVIEPTAGTTSSGVTSASTYSNRLAAVRANPTSGTYIGWSFTNNYDSALSGDNNLVPSYAFAALRQLGIQVVANITSGFSLGSSTSWSSKWPIWRHYYAEAFYLARTYDVQRYQMYNEPNYSTPPSISEPQYLWQLQVASDAIQSAIADVNRLYGKSLVPLVLAPVTSGSADGSYSGASSDFGALVVTNRHLNQYEVVDPAFSLIQKYDYHQYDGLPTSFYTSLGNLHVLLTNAMAPEAAYPVTASEFNVYTGATFATKTNDSLDTPADYSRFADIAAYLVQNRLEEGYCFKFSQTTSSSTGNPTKNGMLYVENNSSPYNIGGITRAGEVWRLFSKGLHPGQNRFGSASATGLPTSYQLSYDPIANRYYIFAANNSTSPLNWTADLTAWQIPAGNLVQVEEVSESCYGAVKFATNLGSARQVGGLQPANSAWLLTIPAAPQAPLLSLVATDDATVRDGTGTNVNYGSATNLLVGDSATTRNNRSAGLLKFRLPAGFGGTNLQLALLSLHAASAVGASNSQAHVYGLAATNWSQSTVTWLTAPNLKHGVAAGANIPNNVVLGVGDWTNSTTPVANSAQLLGQVVADANYTERLVDVTDFIKRSTNADVTFLVAREVRFAGDLAADDGISIISTEADPGTAPQLKLVFNSTTAPAISQIACNPDRSVTLGLSGTPGLAFSLQATTNLLATNWLVLLNTNLPATNWNYTDPSASNDAARFYQVTGQ
jgi:hypothetical protein